MLSLFQGSARVFRSGKGEQLAPDYGLVVAYGIGIAAVVGHDVYFRYLCSREAYVIILDEARFEAHRGVVYVAHHLAALELVKVEVQLIRAQEPVGGVLGIHPRFLPVQIYVGSYSVDAEIAKALDSVLRFPGE